MSSLFSVLVLGVEEGVARVRFSVVHPDQRDVCDATTIALQVFLEIYLFMREGYRFDGEHARREELGAAYAAAHPMAVELARWLEMSRGKKVAISKEEYEELCRGEGPWSRHSGGFDRTGYYVEFEPDHRGVYEVSSEQILEVWLEDELNNPRKVSGDRPEATLCFRVKDEALLSLLIPGLRWGSAMYDHAEYF